MNKVRLEEAGLWPNFRCFSGIALEVLKKITIKNSQFN